MPWKECHIMDERVRFVARLLDGEKMAPLWVRDGDFEFLRSHGRRQSGPEDAECQHPVASKVSDFSQSVSPKQGEMGVE